MDNIVKTNEIDAKLIGYIIKQERMKKNISASKLALGIKKSRQYVSDIEKGVKPVSHATIAEIFQYLHISFKFQKCEAVQELFQKFIQYFYMRDLPNAINRLASIITNETYKYTYEYPLIILSEIIFQELTHAKNNFSMEVFEFLNEEQRCILLYFKGVAEFNNKNYTEALQVFQNAKKYIVFSLRLQGLIYLAEALVYDKLNDNLKCLDFNKLAKNEFSKDHNIERSLTCSLHIANTYSKIGRLDEAIRLYFEIIEDAKRFQITRITDLIHCNLAVTYLYDQQFLKAIEIAEKYVETGKYKEDYYFILGWAYYETQDQEKSKYYLDKLMECENLETFLQHIVTLQSLRLQPDLKDEMYELYLHQVIEQVLKNELLPDKIFIIKHAIRFYESIKDYAKAFEYSTLLNTLLENRI